MRVVNLWLWHFHRSRSICTGWGRTRLSGGIGASYLGRYGFRPWFSSPGLVLECLATPRHSAIGLSLPFDGLRWRWKWIGIINDGFCRSVRVWCSLAFQGRRYKTFGLNADARFPPMRMRHWCRFCSENAGCVGRRPVAFATLGYIHVRMFSDSIVQPLAPLSIPSTGK